jgi:hypothetical protein
MTQKKNDDDIAPIRIIGGLLLLILVGLFYLFPLSLLDKARAMITLRRKDTNNEH